MKRETYSSHTEVVIDKEYNERKKAEVHIGRILIIIAIEFVILCMNVKNSTKELLMITVCLSWFSLISIDGIIGEYKLNRKLYPYSTLIGIITIAGTIFSLLNYYGIIGDGHTSPIVILVVVFAALIISSIVYICIRSILNKKERLVSVSAVCCDNVSSVEQRFVDNMHHDKIERARSAAYAGDYVTLFTPIFRFTYNGMNYEAKSNISRNAPLEVGSAHIIKINPNNPSEISAGF